jgi:hypothetical protein
MRGIRREFPVSVVSGFGRFGFRSFNTDTPHTSLDLGLYSAGNYRTGHLPRRGLVDFTSSQISPITL